ncbi:MAG: energy transducer TonB [Deltaproteobacteria bacterium]|nr:energy transducer TonB [Deltaproteobacteria bacterium]
MGIRGRVLVKFLVKDDGSVARASIVEAIPSGLFDQSALRAIVKWKFRPGRYQGRDVATWVVVPISFKLSQ